MQKFLGKHCWSDKNGFVSFLDQSLLVLWTGARRLDQQILRGDPSLLTTSTYKREEIIQAPQGSTIMEGQIVQLPGQYVQPTYVQQNQLQK